MKTRNLGQLSSAHVLRLVAGLELVFKTHGVKLDAEEKRRFAELKARCKPLLVEAELRTVDLEPEAKVGVLDARIDRKWFVFRDVLVAFARLADELPLGEEAARLAKKYFANGVWFTHQDCQLQLQHGKGLLAQLESEELSAAMKAFLEPLIERLRRDHVLYEAALGEVLVQVKRPPQLQAVRVEALEALDQFVNLVEIMASSEKARARADRILAPVDAMLDMVRRTGKARERGEKGTGENGGKPEPAPVLPEPGPVPA